MIICRMAGRMFLEMGFLGDIPKIWTTCGQVQTMGCTGQVVTPKGWKSLEKPGLQCTFWWGCFISLLKLLTLKPTTSFQQKTGPWSSRLNRSSREPFPWQSFVADLLQLFEASKMTLKSNKCPGQEKKLLSKSYSSSKIHMFLSSG